MDWEVFLNCRNPHRGLDKELRGEPNAALILRGWNYTVWGAVRERPAQCFYLNMLGILILTLCHTVHVEGEEVKGNPTSVCLRSPDAFFHLPTHLFEFGSFYDSFPEFC